MPRRGVPDIDMTTPAGRMGLTLRLRRQRIERERLNLPPVQIPDQPTTKEKGGRS